MMQISSISDFRAAVRNGPYAWPGGYPVYFVCDDGAALCCACVNTERRNILESLAHKQKGDGWHVVGADINYEDSTLYCDQCSERIESAYSA
jgi:hypothetical protein